MSAAELWQRLQREGAVEGDQPAHVAESPWFVRAMLGVAGWIGALFLIGFIGVAFSSALDSAATTFILGTACCGGAFALFRGFDGNDFVEQFALAVSIAGQILIGFGLSNVTGNDMAAFFLGLAAVEAILVVLVPNFLHRALSSCGAAIALALGLVQLEIHGLSPPLFCLGLALIWLEPKLWATDGRLWRPVGYGLALALLLAETFRLFDLQSWLGTVTQPGWIRLYGPLLGRMLVALILAWAAATIARRQQPPASGRVILAAGAAALLFGLLAVDAPGLASATLILLLGFAAGNRLLMTLGILSLFGFIGHYYYSLHATLLEKSGLLALTGLGLLAAHAALRRFAPPPTRESANA
jgi:hypothetical protein